MGGYNGGDILPTFNNEVWYAIPDDGYSWFISQRSATWNSRAGMASILNKDSLILLLGGEDSNGVYNDVWQADVSLTCEFFGKLCGSHGACINGLCGCDQGWAGGYCGSPVCIPECQNGGNCYAPNTCGCPKGFSGPTCATDSNSGSKPSSSAVGIVGTVSAVVLVLGLAGFAAWTRHNRKKQNPSGMPLYNQL